MPWSGNGPPYGFADQPVRTWLPQPPDWGTLTVEAQLSEADSMLNLYRAALRLRREHPALGDGAMTWLDSGADELTFVREPGFCFAANLGHKPVSLPSDSRILLASGPLDGSLLPGDTAVWLQR
jgi:alpha-glucosidase